MVFIISLFLAMIWLLYLIADAPEARHWLSDSGHRRLYLSLAGGLLAQVPLVTMLPGWIVAASIVGKSEHVEIAFEIVAVITNTVFYAPIIYVLLGWLSDRRERKEMEQGLGREANSHDLLSISSWMQRAPKDRSQ